MEIKTLADIKGLIEARIEEGLRIEYKRELGRNSDIAKEVCAFANNEGGTIIYGVDSKDRIPITLSWIREHGVEERIQSVIATCIQPKLEGISISRYPDPSDQEQAVFVVEVPKSASMPHMSNERYYKRRGSTSTSMDHEEVRNTMLGPARATALRFEVSANLELLAKTSTLIERVMVISPNLRKRVALIPFHTDAWDAIIASGLLLGFPENTIKDLLDAYAIIHEINSLIDWLKIEKEPIVHTPGYEDSSGTAGIYVPHVLTDKLGRLRTLLDKMAKSL
jgi:hypothetical protein